MVTEEVKPKKKIAKRQSRFKLALSGFNRKYIDEAVKFYLDRGIDPMIISGIFGNISKESDWNPLANSKDNGLGDFYGLVLMSPDMRKEVKRVYGKVDANTTHLFIYDSMTGNKKISPAWRSYMKDYGGYWNNKYNDPETAAMAFGTVFERPSEKYADWGERMRSARDAYDHIISITNALKNAKAKSFGNPIKTTVTADGNKVMTVNPEYWEQLGMLQPVQKEQPVLQSVLIEPTKTIAPRIEDVAPAPWDLNLLALNRGIESTPQKSPFSLRLRLPSLTSLLLLNSPEELAKQYFADALGISDLQPEMPSLFPRFKCGKLPRYADGTSNGLGSYSYAIPFDESKRITLSNAGLATGAVLSTNVLDSIANASHKVGLDLDTAVGLAIKESTLGNPTDTREMRKLLSPIRRQLLKKQLEDAGIPYEQLFGQHINDGGITDERHLINYWIGPQLEEEGVEGLQDYPSALEAGFKFYKEHPDKYNPGQKNHQQLVLKRASEIKNSPEYQEWKREYNAKMALLYVMQPKPYDVTVDWNNDQQQLFNGFKDGKSPIRIKPANRGKFTRLKKRTGKSASWFKAHGTPALKKMATFALNAKKWRH